MTGYIALGQSVWSNDTRIARGQYSITGAFTPTDITAYFVYLGFCVELITPLRLWFVLTTNSTSGTAEVGFFSTPDPPKFATGQTLTKIVAGATESITAGATKLVKNSSNFATALTVPVHCWGGLRVDQNGASNAVVRGVGNDYTDGSLLQLASAGTFASTSTFAGVVPALSGTGTINGPDLIGSLN